MKETHHKGNRTGGATGFTLVELMVAIAISSIVLAGVSIAFLQTLRMYQQEQIYNELSYNLEIATEHIRRDLRLSSVGIGLMTFYPKGGTEYTAISMPKAKDTTNDGFLDRDSEGKLIWRETVVYHVEPGSPDKLMRTTFSPRNTNATPDEVYHQLADVAVAITDADYQAACLAGENVVAQQIFANLVQIKFMPADAGYDTYAATPTKGPTFNWGSVVLDPGMHEVTFRVTGKNAASSGYKLGIDRFYLTRSSSWREGEWFTPVHSRPAAPHYRHTISDGSVAAALMGSSWAWSGNSELTYTGTGTNSTITFEVYNDLWHESAFDTPGWQASNAVVTFDHHFATVAPFIPEWTVAPDKGIAWEPIGVETNIVLADTAFLTVTNFLYGGVTTNDSTLVKNGCWARFEFQREPDSGLIVTNAWVIAPDGTASNIMFNGGPGITVEADGPIQVWSDWVEMWETDITKTYQVRFETVSQAPENLYDLLTGRQAENLSLYVNTGTKDNPAFDALDPVNPYGDPPITVGAQSSYPKFADINGNGLLDLFIGRQDGRITHYLNTGTKANPVWTKVTDTFAGIDLLADTHAIPAFADIDGDGDLDLFVGSADGKLRFYKNTGTPTAPAWAAPVVVGWQGIEPGARHAPEFVDINKNGLLDLFIGVHKNDGYISFYKNIGSPTNAVMNLVVAEGWKMADGLSGAARRPYPAFANLYDYADGRKDMFVGEQDGKIKYFPHPGLVGFDATAWAAVAPANAAWQNIDTSINLGVGKPHGHNASPAFGNIHARSSILTAWSYDDNVDPLATVNGVETNASLVLSAVEVGYPKVSLFLSGVFDTRMDAPEYNRLNWTQIENWPAGDIDIRVRSSDARETIDSADWQIARWDDEGYFQVNVNNSLANLGRHRYVQYEAIFLINADPSHPRPHAHTNARPDAILRDVTIDWPGAVGLVDLVTEFGHRPDGAIVEATVNDQKLVKGIAVEMEIFKDSRTGKQSVRGVLEVRPLNTGK